MIDADDLGAPRVGLKTQVKSGLTGLAVRTPLHGGPMQLISVSDSEESDNEVIINNQTNAYKPTSKTDKDNNSDVICESGEVEDLTVGSEKHVETPNNINKRRSSHIATENGNIVLIDPVDPSKNCNDINKNPENNLQTSVNKCDAEILKQKEDACLSDVTCESVLTIARNDTEILKMLEEHFHFPNDVNNLEKEHDELVPKINNEYVNSTAEVDVIQNGNAFSTNSPDSIVSVSEDSVGTKDTFDKLLKTNFPSVESLLDAIKDAEDAKNADADVNGYKDKVNRKTEEKLDDVDGVVPEIINLEQNITKEQVTLKEQTSESITQEEREDQEEGNKEPDFDEMREEVVREFNNLCDSFQSSNDEHNDKYVEAEDVTNYQDIVDELEKNERVVENRDDNAKADDIGESQDFGTIEGDLPKRSEATEEITLVDRPKSVEGTETITLVDSPKSAQATEEIILGDPPKSLEVTKEITLADPPKRLEATDELSSDESFKTANFTPIEDKLESELEDTESREKESESDQNISRRNEDKQQTKNNLESPLPPISLHQELEESQKEVDEDKQQTKNNSESTPLSKSQQELEESLKEIKEDKLQTKNNSESTPPPISSQQELEDNQKEVEENVTSAVDTPKENSDNVPMRRKAGRPKKGTENKKSTAISNSTQEEKIISGNAGSVSNINDSQENEDDDKAQKQTSYNKINSLEKESDTNPKNNSNIAPEIIKVREEYSEEEPNLSHMESEISSKAQTKTHSKPSRTTEKRTKVLKSKNKTEDAKSSENISDIKESRPMYAKRNPSRRKTIHVENPTDQSKNNEETLLEKQNLTISTHTIKKELENEDDDITSSKNYSDTPSRIKVRKRGRPKRIINLETKNNEENIQERSSTKAVNQKLKIEDKKKGRLLKVQRNIQRVSDSKEDLEKGEKKITEEKKKSRLSLSKDTEISSVLSPVQVVKRGRGRPPKDHSKGKVSESPANLHKNKRSGVDHSLTRITRRTSEINKELSNKKSSDINLPRTRESVSKIRIKREDNFNDKKENKRKRKYHSSDNNSSQDEENSGNETEKTGEKNYSPLRKSRRSQDKKIEINLNKKKKNILNNSSNQNTNISISEPLKKRGRPRKRPLIENKKVMIFKRGRGRPRNRSRSDERYYCKMEKDEDFNPATSPLVVLKKIGRPRKSLRNSNLKKIKDADNDIDIDANETNLPKRKGRPPKYKKKKERISTITKNKSYSKDRSSNLHKRKAESISDLEPNALGDTFDSKSQTFSAFRKRQNISEKYEDDEEEERLFKECFLNWKPDQSTITKQLYNNNNTPMVKIENFVPDMAIESGALSKISGPSNNDISTGSTEINQQIVKTEFSENLDKLKMLYDDVHFFNSLLPYIENLSENKRFIFKLKIQKLTTKLINKDRKYSSL